MSKWRECAFREVRDELDRFLNFPLTDKISLGDYGVYGGRKCRFDWKGNVLNLGAQVESTGFQYSIAELYGTQNAVTVQSKLLFGKKPAASISFNKKRALCFKACRIGLDRVALDLLEHSMAALIASGKLEWHPNNVIVTEVWHAEGFTQLVSGGAKAGVEITASMTGAQLGFDFADPKLQLSVGSHTGMAYQAVGQQDVQPYFRVHRMRRNSKGNWKLYRYSEDETAFSRFFSSDELAS